MTTIGLILITGVFCIFVALKYLVPSINKMFSIIWEDETFTQGKEIRKRAKELMVDSEIPEETAVLMASKEMRVSEENLLNAVEAMSPADLKKIITGKNVDMISIISGKLSKALKSKTGRGR